MKKILFLLVLSIFSNINSKESSHCTDDGSIICRPNQTCCLNKSNPTGYNCLSTIEGNCCANGESACPKESKCNRNLSCENSKLTFLGNNYEASNELISFSSNPIVREVLNSSDIFYFIGEFVYGLGIFKNVVRRSKCLHNPEFVNEVGHLVRDLRNLITHPGPHFFEDLNKITHKMMHDKDIYLNEFAQCERFAQVAVHSTYRIERILSDYRYPQKLAAHTGDNIGEIKNKLERIIHERNMNVMAYRLGELFRYLFLWQLDDKH